MSSVGEAAAALARASDSTSEAVSAARAATESLDGMASLLTDALEGVTRSDAEEAMTTIARARDALDEVIGLVNKADAAVRQYASDVLQVDLGSPSPAGSTADPSASGIGQRRDDLTYPSRPPDPSAVPRGRPARIQPNDDEDTKRGHRRENEGAYSFAKLGYDIEQTPVVPGPKNPDYRLEGRIFDAHSPATPRARNIWSTIEDKVAKKQASRHVIYLDDTPVTVADLRRQFHDHPIDGLEEVLVMRDGQPTRLFP
jgi:Contact-dependent growth inhibition CdiA C-terminal domain